MQKYPKRFLNYIKKNQNVIYPVGPLEREDGSLTEGSAECAEVIGNLFRSVFVIEDASNIPAFPTQVAQHVLLKR